MLQSIGLYALVVYFLIIKEASNLVEQLRWAMLLKYGLDFTVVLFFNEKSINRKRGQSKFCGSEQTSPVSAWYQRRLADAFNRTVLPSHRYLPTPWALSTFEPAPITCKLMRWEIPRN